MHINSRRSSEITCLQLQNTLSGSTIICRVRVRMVWIKLCIQSASSSHKCGYRCVGSGQKLKYLSAIAEYIEWQHHSYAGTACCCNCRQVVSDLTLTLRAFLQPQRHTEHRQDRAKAFKWVSYCLYFLIGQLVLSNQIKTNQHQIAWVNRGLSEEDQLCYGFL